MWKGDNRHNLSACVTQTEAFLFLKYLDAYLNKVKPSDISFLSHTNLLETIAMQESNLTDISVFEQLTELNLVMIQKNMITDISPIVRIEGIDGGIVRISENCLDISAGQDLADINNLKNRGVTVNYTPQNNCN